MSLSARHPTTPSESTQTFKEIGDVIDRYYAGRDDALIQVLHTAQEIYGFLSLDLQKFVAAKLHTSLAEVAGVVSFYSFFATTPRGKYTIRVCLGTACYVRGGKTLVDHLLKKLDIKLGETTEDGLFTFEIARCIGACGLAPALMIDDRVYKQMTPAKIDRLLAELVQGGDS